MNKEFCTTLYAYGNTLHFDENSGNFIFSCNGMGNLNVDLTNINLDNSFDDDDLHTSVLIKILACHIKFEERKTPLFVNRTYILGNSRKT